MRQEYERKKDKISVFLETADGDKRDVTLSVFHGESLANVLNSASQFIEVQDLSGKTILIAKSFIWQLTPDENTEKSASPVAGEKWRHHSQDPYVLLDISRDASDDEVREAYHKLARAYHPDKLANLDLPASMIAHGVDIFQKVNTAYKTITEQRRKKADAA